jgi:hypothetical protein
MWLKLCVNSITAKNHSILYAEIFAIYSENYTEHVELFFMRNARFINVTAIYIYIYIYIYIHIYIKG